MEEKKDKLKKDLIFKVIKRKIIENEYYPGEILNEAEIARDLKVSRTPVRNVFMELEFLGLIKIVPRYGVEVSQIDLKSMKSLLDITKALEPMAVAEAMDYMDDETIEKLRTIVDREKSYDFPKDTKQAVKDDERFHQILINKSNNVWLIDTLMRLHYHTERLWHYMNANFETSEIFSQTLSEILEAIEKGDKEEAKEKTKAHIEEFFEKLKNTLL